MLAVQSPRQNETFDLFEDAEDLVRYADKLIESLVLRVPAGTDLSEIRDWKRRVERYFNGK